MIDDHDRCELVNVSSGTGSPGLTQTNSESRKMFAVVVVVTVEDYTCLCCNVLVIRFVFAVFV